MHGWLDPEIAWAAGLFEGEGTITSSRGRLVARLNNTDEEVVRHFAMIIGLGEVMAHTTTNSRTASAASPSGFGLPRNMTHLR
jgi:hypothetical protein